jgi:hypothetical protein
MESKRKPSLVGPIVVMAAAVLGVPVGVALLPAGAGLGGALLAALIIFAAGVVFLVGFLWSLVVLFLRRPIGRDAAALVLWVFNLVVAAAFAAAGAFSIAGMARGDIIDLAQFGYSLAALVIASGVLVLELILVLPGPAGLTNASADEGPPGR